MKPAPLPTAAPLPHHLPSLDGLRGLAIVLVLLHNFDVLDLAGPHSLAAALLKEVFFLGWIGVQLFFVLSGFLITRGLLATQQSNRYFSHFMLKRALRIFPLYYLALLLFTLLLPKLGLIAPPADPTWWLWVYLANWSIPLHLGGESMPHFWSLAVEEQFYLLWPLLLWRLRLRQVAWLCLALMLLSPLLRWLLMRDGAPPEALYEFTICRMDALAAGAALAAWFHRPLRDAQQLGAPTATGLIDRQIIRRIECCSASRWGVLAASLLVASALASHGFWRLGETAQVLGYSLLALSFTAMLGWAVLSDQAASRPEDAAASRRWSPARLLRTPLLRMFGKYSYGLYVFHKPLHDLVGAPLLARLGHAQISAPGLALLYFVVATGVTLMVAWLSWHGLERHFLALKPSDTPPLHPASAPHAPPLPPDDDRAVGARAGAPAAAAVHRR